MKRFVFTLAVALGCVATAAVAQDTYPVRPITLAVPPVAGRSTADGYTLLWAISEPRRQASVSTRSSPMIRARISSRS